MSDKAAAGELADRDERGVEIGWINGVNPRTADALCEAGLAEIVNIRCDQSWLFLVTPTILSRDLETFLCDGSFTHHLLAHGR